MPDLLFGVSFFGGRLSLCGGRALANWVLTVASLRGYSCWGSCPFVVVTERQAAGVGGMGPGPPGAGAPALAVSPFPSPLSWCPFPPGGALEALAKESRADGFPPLPPNPNCFSFLAHPHPFGFYQLLGATVLPPLFPSSQERGPSPAWELRREETARGRGHPRAAPHPAPGEGRAPLPAGSPSLPGVLCCRIFYSPSRVSVCVCRSLN